MARSIWKNPFVDRYVIEKVDKYIESGKKGGVINIMSRRSTIIPDFIGIVFGVYNGKKFIPVTVSEIMVGHKFGEFSPTRTYYGHGADKKIKRKK